MPLFEKDEKQAFEVDLPDGTIPYVKDKQLISSTNYVDENLNTNFVKDPISQVKGYRVQQQLDLVGRGSLFNAKSLVTGRTYGAVMQQMYKEDIGSPFYLEKDSPNSGIFILQPIENDVLDGNDLIFQLTSSIDVIVNSFFFKSTDTVTNFRYKIYINENLGNFYYPSKKDWEDENGITFEGSGEHEIVLFDENDDRLNSLLFAKKDDGSPQTYNVEVKFDGIGRLLGDNNSGAPYVKVDRMAILQQYNFPTSSSGGGTVKNVDIAEDGDNLQTHIDNIEFGQLLQVAPNPATAYSGFTLTDKNNIKAPEIKETNNIIMTRDSINGVGPFDPDKNNTLKVLHISHHNAYNIKTTKKDFENISIDEIRIHIIKQIISK